MTADYQVELTNLSNEIRAYREGLTAQQRLEFDSLWGLDQEGCFKSSDNESHSWWHRLFGQLSAKSDTVVNVHQAVLSDLRAVDLALAAELKRYPANERRENVSTSPLTEIERRSRRDVGKRLLFLFQCDLLPGVSGQILQSKGGRDAVAVAPVRGSTRIAGIVFLVMLNVGMLFYILLFALRQTSQRQSAWFQSFILWMIVEILFVSTAMVLFTHILIPMFAMKDVTRIKQRLLDSIRDFHSSVARGKDELALSSSLSSSSSADEKQPVFNAAKYLFVSTRLAQFHPFVKEASIILRFSTPWPKQSYQHYSDVSKTYSKKYTAISRSLTIVVMFFLTNLLHVPPSLQDMMIHMVTTASIGYTILLHIELFHIFPILVVVPFLFLCVIAHFVIQAGKAGARKRLAQLLPAKQEKATLTVNGSGAPGVKSGKCGVAAVATAAAGSGDHVTRRQSVMQSLSVVKDLRQVRREQQQELQSLEEESEESLAFTIDYDDGDVDDDLRSEDIDALMQELDGDESSSDYPEWREDKEVLCYPPTADANTTAWNENGEIEWSANNDPNVYVNQYPVVDGEYLVDGDYNRGNQNVIGYPNNGTCNNSAPQYSYQQYCEDAVDEVKNDGWNR